MTIPSACATCSTTGARRWRCSEEGPGATSTPIGSSICRSCGCSRSSAKLRREPPPTRGQPVGLPWAEIVGLRNRVIHGDDEVDFDIVWETVMSDLPPMIRAIERHLESA